MHICNQCPQLLRATVEHELNASVSHRCMERSSPQRFVCVREWIRFQGRLMFASCYFVCCWSFVCAFESRGAVWLECARTLMCSSLLASHNISLGAALTHAASWRMAWHIFAHRKYFPLGKTSSPEWIWVSRTIACTFTCGCLVTFEYFRL